MECEHIDPELTISSVHEQSDDLSKAKQCHRCGKVKIGSGYIEDKYYETYCKDDNHKNCETYQMINV